MTMATGRRVDKSLGRRIALVPLHSNVGFVHDGDLYSDALDSKLGWTSLPDLVGRGCYLLTWAVGLGDRTEA